MAVCPMLQANDLHLYYGENEALKGIDIEIQKNEITALIGPSGCGKSTFLKTLNRMNDLIPNVRIQGEVKLARTEYLCSRGRCDRPAPTGWHGVPKGKPLPDEYL